MVFIESLFNLGVYINKLANIIDNQGEFHKDNECIINKSLSGSIDVSLHMRSKKNTIKEIEIVAEIDFLGKYIVLDINFYDNGDYIYSCEDKKTFTHIDDDSIDIFIDYIESKIFDMVIDFKSILNQHLNS